MSNQSFAKNARYALSASVVTLVVNVVLLVILPNFLSVTSYGFYQLYLFYATYVGLAHFGLVDGVYLKLGGSRLESLNRSSLSGTALLLGCWQIVIMLVAWAAGSTFAPDRSYLVVWRGVAACIFVTNVRFLFVYILQATASAREAAICTIADRLSYLVVISALALGGTLTLEAAIVCDLFTKAVSLSLSVVFCRTIFTRVIPLPRAVFADAVSYINPGVKLLLANLASSFIIGAARLGVERRWSVDEFAFVSLALGVATVAVSVVNSVGIALFPFLRRLSAGTLSTYYVAAREMLSPLLLGSLVLYLPMRAALILVLPAYAQSAAYLGCILPIVAFEGKVALLSNQMLKSLRLERYMLIVNVVSLGASVFLTWVGCVVVGSVYAVLSGVVIVLVSRSAAIDAAITAQLGVHGRTSTALEVALALLFVGETVAGDSFGWRPFLSSAAILCYFVVRGPRMRESWNVLRDR